MFILIDDEAFPIDTNEQAALAREALKAADLQFALVWHGDPDDPDAYKSSESKLFAARGDQ